VPGGRTVVDHQSRAQDDVANALCLAVALAMAPQAVSAGILIANRPPPPPIPAPLARLDALRHAMRARPRVTGLG
jgi:hypothetical protein